MSSTESVVLAVVIVESSYVRGLKFEVDIVEMLRSIGVKVIYRGSERSFFLVFGVPELA
ncbi:4648_t:CDS:2 [Cetraspora pellucida]|uniref:4648_t:CDS:1 n=1 Tax=Cetraspora pellucida TaxID=1433469 RepID=A0ACA9PA64_9GLOM|nr:4648_t:CDS:2 [Cetraspora pellucida]